MRHTNKRCIFLLDYHDVFLLIAITTVMIKKKANMLIITFEKITHLKCHLNISREVNMNEGFRSNCPWSVSLWFFFHFWLPLKNHWDDIIKLSILIWSVFRSTPNSRWLGKKIKIERCVLSLFEYKVAFYVSVNVYRKFKLVK